MGWLNWLLLNLGDGIRWLGRVLARGAADFWDLLHDLLNPVLSPLLAAVNPPCTAIADGVYTLLAPLPVWLGITLISALVGVLMLIGFRYTSNQKAIGRARDDITANLLALKLFKDDIVVGFRAQGRLLAALGRLQWHMLRPLIIMLLPMLLVLGQMGLRYQWRPLRPGEQTLVRVQLQADSVDVPDIELDGKNAVHVEAGPIAGAGEIVWRVRGGEPGRHTVGLRIGDQIYTKELVIGAGFERVSALRATHNWTRQILHPAESPLSADAPIRAIQIDYGAEDSWIYGANWWILYFFIVSMIAALLLKPVFKVRI